MAVPVWLWPATKTVATWVVTHGPSVIELSKKYGPPAIRAYKQHGFKPIRIFTDVSQELSSASEAELATEVTAPVKESRSTP